jgi:hypothetical protein
VANESVEIPFSAEGDSEVLAQVEAFINRAREAADEAGKAYSAAEKKARDAANAQAEAAKRAAKAQAEAAREAAEARKWAENNVAKERERISAEYNARLKQTENAAESLNKKLAGEFAANQINKLGEAFTGTAQRAVEAAASTLQGFAQGGPVPAALALVNAAIIEGVGEWQKWRDAERAAHLSAIENVEKLQAAFEASSNAVEASIAARKEAVSLIEAQNFAQRVGIGLDEAKLLLERQSLREQIEGKRKKLEADRAAAGITDPGGDTPELAARSREIAALAALERQREAEQDASANARRLAREAKAAADAKAARDKSQAEWIEAQKLRQKQWDDEQKVRDEQARRHVELQDKRERETEQRAAQAAERAAQEQLARQVRAQSFAREIEAENQARILAQRQAANAEADELVSESIQREIALRDQQLNAALATGEQLARLALEFADSESTKTQAQYEEAAKRAAIEAAMQGALAFANYALGRPDQAVAAGIAAAQYAAIATGSLLASAAAPAESPAAKSAVARDAGSGSTAAAAGRGFGRGGGRDTERNITVVLPSNGLFVTRADTTRAVADALNEASRRR